ncbi:MAG: NAD(P)/FAD-dependent oxidoreductase [Hyphomicrobiaceae bacterium]
MTAVSDAPARECGDKPDGIRGSTGPVVIGMKKNVRVVGGGFAGLWAALAAARYLDELGIGRDDVEISLINRDAWHAIRVRNYEADLETARVKLDQVLAPAGIAEITGTVTAIDVGRRAVGVETGGNTEVLPYDRLVLASGSQLDRPPIKGLAAHAFAIDTWQEAAALRTHMDGLSRRPPCDGRDAVVIVGAGFTGIELACEMPERLRACGISSGRVILLDRNPSVGSEMTGESRAVVNAALKDLGVEVRNGVSVASIDATSVELADGSRIAAETVIWTAGMRASPLARLVPASTDVQGRLSVDTTMRVVGVDGVFAAGDVAGAPLLDGHSTVMSCQFARPMGRFAGHNAVADVLGHDLLAMNTDRYVTCLDLGPSGALFTQGWDRRLVASGADAKRTKMTINRERIYPPRSMTRHDLFAAATPVVQASPTAGKIGNPGASAPATSSNADR